MKLIQTAASVTLLVGLSACATQRANLTALSRQQDQYFKNVEIMFRDNAKAFQDSLNVITEANQERRERLLAWERDQLKADILLQQDGNVKKEKRLLLTKLSDIDIRNIQDHQDIVDAERGQAEALVDFFNAMAGGTQELRENNEIILKYLEEGDFKFFVRSIDRDGIKRTIDVIEQARDQYNEAQARVQSIIEKKRAQHIEEIRSALETLVDSFSNADGT
jgi:hypothetical protein